MLGTGKFLIGPTAVALTIQGPWLVGLLVNNVFSVAGKSDRRDVSQALIQPIVNFNMKGGWYLAASPIMTTDWKKDSDRWTVPLGGGVGKVFHLGKQALNAYLQAFSNVVRPDNASKWSLRFQVQFLFPKH